MPPTPTTGDIRQVGVHNQPLDIGKSDHTMLDLTQSDEKGRFQDKFLTYYAGDEVYNDYVEEPAIHDGNIDEDPCDGDHHVQNTNYELENTGYGKNHYLANTNYEDDHYVENIEDENDDDPEYGMFAQDEYLGPMDVMKRKVREKLGRTVRSLKDIRTTNVQEARLPWYKHPGETTTTTSARTTTKTLGETTVTTSPARTTTTTTATSAKRSMRHPMRLMEIFTFTAMATAVASERGWQTCNPVSLETGYDLLTHDGRTAAWRHIERENPDALVVAWPCDPWSSIQNLNRQRPDTWLRILHRRTQHRALTKFAARCEKRQRDNHKLFLGENPLGSAAWKLPEMKEMFRHCHEALPHMCAYGLRDPATQLYLRKATRIVTSSLKAAELLSRRCPRDHYHRRIEGTTRNKAGKRVNLSSVAGGYTRQFCEEMNKGFEHGLAHGTYASAEFAAQRRQHDADEAQRLLELQQWGSLAPEMHVDSDFATQRKSLRCRRPRTSGDFMNVE